jgi:hypothetical protein
MKFGISKKDIFVIIIQSFLLLWLSYFLDFITRYSNSVIFTTVTQPFLHFVIHFWDFIAHYSNLAIFAIVTQPFLYFVSHFWDFVVQYSNSSIFVIMTHPFFLQWLSHILDFIGYFWDFTQSFLWFCHTWYSDSVIFLILTGILEISSVIF